MPCATERLICMRFIAGRRLDLHLVWRVCFAGAGGGEAARTLDAKISCSLNETSRSSSD